MSCDECGWDKLYPWHLEWWKTARPWKMSWWDDTGCKLCLRCQGAFILAAFYGLAELLLWAST